MNERKVNILGTEYTIRERSQKEDKKMEGDGYTDWTTREIIVRREREQDLEENSVKNIDAYVRLVTRHEIVHAFLFESGLDSSALHFCAWTQNEEMVDWFAIQGQKIYKAWQEADALD